MTTFLKTMIVTGLMCGASGAALAASHEMDASSLSCADFLAMDETGRMNAMEGLQMAMAEGEDAMMAEGDDAMMAEDDDAMMADDGGNMMGDDMSSLMSACEEHPDMMAMDVMGEMNAN